MQLLRRPTAMSANGANESRVAKGGVVEVMGEQEGQG